MGGLVGRGIIQKCHIGRYVKKLITLGTPHMGVSKLPQEEESFMGNILDFFV